MSWLWSIPKISRTAPSAEVVTATGGVAATISASDHAHPRLTSTSWAVLDTTGKATVTFTRSFPSMPGMNFTYWESTDLPPVIVKVESWIQNGGLYTGAVIKGYRLQLLPAMSGLTLVTAVVAALANFNVSAGSASGVNVSVVAILQST